MEINDISGKIMSCAYTVHAALEPGLLVDLNEKSLNVGISHPQWHQNLLSEIMDSKLNEFH